jgi:glycosyltransferase involved in cell wall biosynthesis
MAEPLVSVVIPTWNRATEIRAAIDSVLAQTYSRIELIVVDDGSTDDTPSVLASYRDRIVAIRRENAGVSAARNTGIRAAKGELLAFLDSDDLFDPTKIEKQVALLAAAGPGVVCSLSNAVLTRGSGAMMDCFDFARFRPPVAQGILLNPVEIFLSRFMLFNQTALVPADVLRRVGPFDESLVVLEDRDLALRLGLAGPWVFTTEPLATIRRGTRHSLTSRARATPGLEERCLLGIYAKMEAIDGSWLLELPLRERDRLQPREVRLLRRCIARTGDELQRALAGRSKDKLWMLRDRFVSALWARSPGCPGPSVRPLSNACP